MNSLDKLQSEALSQFRELANIAVEKHTEASARNILLINQNYELRTKLTELKTILAPAIDAAREREKIIKYEEQKMGHKMSDYADSIRQDADKALMQAAELLGIEQEAHP